MRFFRRPSRFATAALVVAAAACPAQQPAQLLSRIPPPFQGRWVHDVAQCRDPREGWAYVSSQTIQTRDGSGAVVSVRLIDALTIDVDLTWRPLRTAHADDDWRQVRRLTLTPDKRQLTEVFLGNSVTRGRCD